MSTLSKSGNRLSIDLPYKVPPLPCLAFTEWPPLDSSYPASDTLGFFTLEIYVFLLRLVIELTLQESVYQEQKRGGGFLIDWKIGTKTTWYKVYKRNIKMNVNNEGNYLDLSHLC